jgi:hypothetical protein
MSYPVVCIANSTPYPIGGTVDYASFFCSNDSYNIEPNGTWCASSRGVCLVTQITATVSYNGQAVNASPYTSSGTSYSQFAVVQTSPGVFAVTRLTSLSDDIDTGEKLPEATEHQK